MTSIRCKSDDHGQGHPSAMQQRSISLRQGAAVSDVTRAMNILRLAVNRNDRIIVQKLLLEHKQLRTSIENLVNDYFKNLTIGDMEHVDCCDGDHGFAKISTAVRSLLMLPPIDAVPWDVVYKIVVMPRSWPRSIYESSIQEARVFLSCLGIYLKKGSVKDGFMEQQLHLLVERVFKEEIEKTNIVNGKSSVPTLIFQAGDLKHGTERIRRLLLFSPDLIKAMALVCPESCDNFITKLLSSFFDHKEVLDIFPGILSLVDESRLLMNANHMELVYVRVKKLITSSDSNRRYVEFNKDFFRSLLDNACLAFDKITTGDNFEKKQFKWEGLVFEVYSDYLQNSSDSSISEIELFVVDMLQTCSLAYRKYWQQFLESMKGNDVQKRRSIFKWWGFLLKTTKNRYHIDHLTFHMDHVGEEKGRILKGLLQRCNGSTLNREHLNLKTMLSQFEGSYYLGKGLFETDCKERIGVYDIEHLYDFFEMNTKQEITVLVEACFEIFDHNHSLSSDVGYAIQVIVLVYFEESMYRQSVTRSVIDLLCPSSSGRIDESEQGLERRNIACSIINIITNSVFNMTDSALLKYNIAGRDLPEEFDVILPEIFASRPSLSLTLPLATKIHVIKAVSLLPKGRKYILFQSQILITIEGEATKRRLYDKKVAIYCLCSLISLKVFSPTDKSCVEALKVIGGIILRDIYECSMETECFLYRLLSFLLSCKKLPGIVINCLVRRIILRCMTFVGGDIIMSQQNLLQRCFSAWITSGETRPYRVQNLPCMIRLLCDATLYQTHVDTDLAASLVSEILGTSKLSGTKLNSPCLLIKLCSTIFAAFASDFVQSNHVSITEWGFERADVYRHLANEEAKESQNADWGLNIDKATTRSPSRITGNAIESTEIFLSMKISIIGAFLHLFHTTQLKSRFSLSMEKRRSLVVISNKMIIFLSNGGAIMKKGIPLVDVYKDVYEVFAAKQGPDSILNEDSSHLQMICISKSISSFSSPSCSWVDLCSLFDRIGFHCDRLLYIFDKCSKHLSKNINVALNVFCSSCELYAQMATEEKAREWVKNIERLKLDQNSSLREDQVRDYADDVVRLFRNRLYLVMNKSIEYIKIALVYPENSVGIIDLHLCAIDKKIRPIIGLLSVFDKFCSFREPMPWGHLIHRLIFDLSSGFYGLSGSMTSTTFKLIVQLIDRICCLCDCYPDNMLLLNVQSNVVNVFDQSIFDLWTLLCKHGIRHTSLLRIALRLIHVRLPTISRKFSHLGRRIGTADEVALLSFNDCMYWFERYMKESDTRCLWPYFSNDENDSDGHVHSSFNDKSTDFQKTDRIRLRSKGMFNIALSSTLSSFESIWLSSLLIMQEKAFPGASIMKNRYKEHRMSTLRETLIGLCGFQKKVGNNGMIAKSLPDQAKVILCSCVDRIVFTVGLSFDIIGAQASSPSNLLYVQESLICFEAFLHTRKKFAKFLLSLRCWFSNEQSLSSDTRSKKRVNNSRLQKCFPSTLTRIDCFLSKIKLFSSSLKRRKNSWVENYLSLRQNESVLALLDELLDEIRKQQASTIQRYKYDEVSKKSKKRRLELHKKRRACDVPRSRNRIVDQFLAMDAAAGYNQDNQTFADLEDFLE